jgi:hypothetical protein
MKFSVSLVTVVACSYSASAFSVSNGGLRRASFLSMNVENVETKTIKVGVIGAGRIGLVHLEAISKAPGVIPIIISNPTVSKAENGEQLLCTY